jgi:hypothetical protein
MDHRHDLSAAINALPEPLRVFVHDLEARVDPAGDVRAAHVQRENALALAARVAELEELLGMAGDGKGTAETALAALQSRVDKALKKLEGHESGCWVGCVSDALEELRG